MLTLRPTGRGTIAGLRIGHATAPSGATGVTVACLDRAALAVVSIRGGASATFDTGSLSLDATFGRRWAIFFAGGSLFGLDAARGIRTALLDAGAGAPVFASNRRIVPIAGAALYDLPPAGAELPDYADLGGAAVRSASPGRCPEGNVGAGAGATVGKYLGRDHAMKGGIGFAAGIVPGGAHVGVLVAVNAIGAVRDPVRGGWIAGARNRAGRIVPPGGIARPIVIGAGTTLALVVTDAPLQRPELLRVVAIAEGGLASVITPYGSATDGDVTFGVSTAASEPEPVARPRVADALGWAASELARRAVRSAIVRANRSPLGSRRSRAPMVPRSGSVRGRTR
ncbi:MAG: P1 family peptidase [Thermoplasmata archaeon]